MLQTVPIEPGYPEIRQLIDKSSIEILPKEAEKIRNGTVYLAPNTRVYIAYTASGAQDDIVRAAEIVSAAGLIPVPHVPARRFYSIGELERFVSQLTLRANVDHVLLIGGDILEPKGAFASSLDALKTGVFERHAIRHIGFAGHPEGHPDVGQEVLRQALIDKARYALEAGMQPYVVTQFLLDTARLFEWHKDFIEPTVPGLPVDVGMPGYAKITTLMRFAKNCGVSTSFAMLTKHAGRALKLAASFSPEEILLDIASPVRKADQPTFRSVHLYPFGSLERTAQWITRLKAQGQDAGKYEISS